MSIPKELIMELVPDGTPPGQYRFNHEDCPAGTDTKRRLYIRVPEDNPAQRIAYCHNCQESGGARGKGLLGGRRAPVLASKARSLIDPPQRVAYDDMPVTAVALLMSAGITEEMCTKYGIFYDERSQRLVYTYRDRDGSILSQQLRSLHPCIQPKYYSIDRYGAEFSSGVLGEGPLLVITEDLLSAIRVAEAGGRALPLRGVYAHTEQLHYEVQNDEVATVLVWLDNDNDNVRERANQIVEAIEMFEVKPVYIYLTEEEPKHIEHNELQEILNEYQQRLCSTG